MKRLALVCILVLAVCGLSHAALVQHTIDTGFGGEDTHSVTLGSAVGSGHLLVASCSTKNTTFSTTAATFSDTLGSTWTVSVNQGPDDAGSNRVRVYIAWAVTSTSGSDTITCDPPCTSCLITTAAAEYSGMATTLTADKTASNGSGSSGSTTVNTGTTAATAQANEVVFIAMAYDSAGTTLTINSPFAQQDQADDNNNYQSLATGDETVSATGTYSGTWTLGAARQWAAGIVTFKIAGAAPTRPRSPAIFMD